MRRVPRGAFWAVAAVVVGAWTLVGDRHVEDRRAARGLVATQASMPRDVAPLSAAPPPFPLRYPHAPPTPESVWQQGEWHYSSSHWTWTDGRWVDARRGWVLVQPMWIEAHGEWELRPATWVKAGAEDGH